MAERPKYPVQLMLGESERLPKTVYAFDVGTHIRLKSCEGTLHSAIIADLLPGKVDRLSRYSSRGPFTLYISGPRVIKKEFFRGTIFSTHKKNARLIFLR